MAWITVVAFIMFATRVSQHQAHIERLSLVARQILADAARLINESVGDKDEVISRLYQLQFAVDVHEFNQVSYGDRILDGLDRVVWAVAAVENSHEEMYVDVDDGVYEELQWERELMDSVVPVHEGKNGRPALNIPADTLQNLIESKYTAIDVAGLLGVTRQTVYDKAKLYGLVFNAGRGLSEEDIDWYVGEVKRDYPRWGRKMVGAAVKFRFGIVISQRNLSRSLQRVDPIGAVTRWAMKIYRRKYNVPGPHYLWHMDCNHKLLEWGFVFYGIIDGYSRQCQCLKVNDHQRADTWLRYFKGAMAKSGKVPQRARGDFGTENYEVAREMNAIRRKENAFIFGRSVHNQRIERMWGDSNVGVAYKYHDLFKTMDHQHGLDGNNALHIYALHLVFMPKIQARCDEWVGIWNSHDIDGENRSPDEMVTDFCDAGLDETDSYGIEYGGKSWPSYKPKEIVLPEKLDVPLLNINYLH